MTSDSLVADLECSPARKDDVWLGVDMVRSPRPRSCDVMGHCALPEMHGDLAQYVL